MPNCKDMPNKNKNPAPGQDEKEDPNAKRAVSADAANQNPAMNFLTNTKRDGFWDNNLNAPFTKATNKVEVPGPGKYDHEKK